MMQEPWLVQSFHPFINLLKEISILPHSPKILSHSPKRRLASYAPTPWCGTLFGIVSDCPDGVVRIVARRGGS
jgi:hypothetical protein